jgi:hypothetical protein
MTLKQVMKELESLGTEQTRKIYRNHGADIEQYGVSIANIKKIAKKLKGMHELGIGLLLSENVDAIYLSQYVVNPDYVTSKELEQVIDQTGYYMLLENVVAPIIARNKKLVDELLYPYLESNLDRKKQVGYTVYSLILGSYDDDLIDYNHVKKMIEYIKQNIHDSDNRVRYTMNNFLIAAGAANKDITELSKVAAKHIGKVSVYMGNTSCKVPDAFDYIEKIEDKGYIGKKRKLK